MWGVCGLTGSLGARSRKLVCRLLAPVRVLGAHWFYLPGAWPVRMPHARPTRRACRAGGAAALLDQEAASPPLSDAAALNPSACWLNRTQQNFKRQRPGMAAHATRERRLSRALQRLPAAPAWAVMEALSADIERRQRTCAGVAMVWGPWNTAARPGRPLVAHLGSLLPVWAATGGRHRPAAVLVDDRLFAWAARDDTPPCDRWMAAAGARLPSALRRSPSARTMGGR